ncbi:MAG: hypothetical protein U0175_28820 [Caldilineaceae bacterium]
MQNALYSKRVIARLVDGDPNDESGDTPANDVTKVRIQKAMKLLVRIEESNERIAETVG